MTATDIQITGTVTWCYPTKNGGSVVRLKDENERRIGGTLRTLTRYISCWFDEPQDFIQGQQIVVTGYLDAMPGTYEKKLDDGSTETRNGVDWSLNGCSITGAPKSGPYISDDEIPF